MDGDQEGGVGPHCQEEKEAEVLSLLVVRKADEEEFRDWSSGVVAGCGHMKCRVQARNYKSLNM